MNGTLQVPAMGVRELGNARLDVSVGANNAKEKGPGRPHGAEEGVPLPGRVRRPLEAFFGADLSTVRLHEGPQAGLLRARALACGEDIYFAPGRLDLSRPEGLALLGHELVHVLQQRALRPTGWGPVILRDAALEAEAELWGRRAAQALLGRPAARPPRGNWAARAGAGRRGAVIQCVLEVDGKIYGAGKVPEPSWGLNPDQTRFYMFLLNNTPTIFYFPTHQAMLGFVKQQCGWYLKFPKTFPGERYAKLCEKITSAVYQDFTDTHFGGTVWAANIAVTTRLGTTVIPVFSSVKRHLITSFMRNQSTPRDRKLMSPVVRKGPLFKEKLIAYAQHHANCLARNLMVFGYNPKQADQNALYEDFDIKFGTDFETMPSEAGAWKTGCMPSRSAGGRCAP
jgi:hypothetical protein